MLEVLAVITILLLCTLASRLHNQKKQITKFQEDTLASQKEILRQLETLKKKLSASQPTRDFPTMLGKLPITSPFSKPETEMEIGAGGTATPPSYSQKTKTQQEETKDFQTRLLTWFQDDWIMKVGGLLVLFAVGWFVSHAFQNNWLGPAGKMGAGGLAAIALLALGKTRITTHSNQGSVFLSIGSTLALVTLFATSQIYNLLPEILCLGLATLTLGFLGKTALQFRSQPLIYLGTSLAAVSPFLLGFYSRTEFTFAYLFLLCLSLTYIHRQWPIPSLPLLTAIIAWLYSTPYLTNSPETLSHTTLFLAFLTFGLLLTQNLYSLSTPNLKNACSLRVAAISSGLTTLGLITWVFKVGPETTAGLLMAGFACLLGAISRYIYTKTASHRVYSFYATWAISTAFATLAISLLLKHTPQFGDAEPLTTLGYLALCVFTLFIANRLKTPSNLSTYASTLLSLPCHSAIASLFSESWNKTIFNLDALCLVVLTGTLFWAGLSLQHQSTQDTDNLQKKKASLFWLILGSLLTACLTWLIFSNSFERNLAIALTLSTYTLAGVICYLKGLTKNSLFLKNSGLFLIACVLARLFLVDLWGMEIGGRIITFLAVGLLLLSTAFFGRKYKTHD